MNRRKRIEKLYLDILGREADMVGLAHHLNSRRELVDIQRQLQQSPENTTANLFKYEHKVFSQNGEDGIIQHIFDEIGTTNKVAVEIGVSVGPDNIYENNTYNLIMQGWSAFWFDCVDTAAPNNCTFTKQLLTADNIVEVFEGAGVPKDMDLLSIDVDGNDYHLRESLSAYNPRVCIMEYNGCFDGTTEYIMERNDDYMWRDNRKDYGASLTSMTIQADRLGYDLVHCDTNGVNAFYVRKDLNCFKTLTPKEAWRRVIWDRTYYD